MNILSFDCANKSLGVAVIHVKDILPEIYYYLSVCNDVLDELITEMDGGAIQVLFAAIKKMEECFINKCQILYINVFDVLDGCKLEDVDTIKRSIMLKKTLNAIDAEIARFEINKVVIEYQMSANDKSRNVMYLLIYHYCQIDNPEFVSLVQPSLKNIAIDKFYSSLYGWVSHNQAIVRRSSAWSANKHHSRENFKLLLNYWNAGDLIKKLKANLPDAADAFYQAVAYANLVW